MNLIGSRPFVALAIGAYLLGCGGSEFGSGSEQDAGGVGGTQGGNAGSISPGDAASTSETGSSGSGGTAQSHDGAAGTAGTGTGGGMDARIICPPCAAPPNPACVGQGICGCGPYVCPEAGKDAALEASGPTCGTAICPLGKVCCNMLKGICTFPDMTCIQ